MKYVPFTKELGQRLLNEGYLHLVHSHRKEEFGLSNPEAIFTIEPTKDLTQGRTLPIKGMIILHAG